MNLKILSQLFSFREIRNGLMGLVVVAGGLALAGLTVWAHRSGNVRLAEIAAASSLGFVLLILIFVIPPLARSASAEASQMDLPFEFTSPGAVYLVLVVIVGFAAWNTGNNLLFLVLSLMISAFIVSFILGNFGLRKLDVKMRFPETIFAGEPTPLIVSLFNKKWTFPTYSILTEVRGKERETSLLLDEIKKILPEVIASKVVRPPILKHSLDYFVFIPTRGTVENRTNHVFIHRGRFIIKDFELSTRFPFGLFRHRRRLSAQEAEIIVFPKVEPVEMELVNLPFETGSRVLPNKGSGQDLHSLREYQPQDDLRHVDWKATARAQRMIVREYAAEDEIRVTVLFDSRLQQTEEECTKSLRKRISEEQKGEITGELAKRFESGITNAASILAYFADAQSEFRLIIDGETGEFGFGKKHFTDCLRRLAVVYPQYFESECGDFPSESLEKAFDESRNGFSYFISSIDEGRLPEVVVRGSRVVPF